MLDTINKEDLRFLHPSRSQPCATICMPTHKAGANGPEDALRLKNLVDRAESQISDGWLRPSEARAMLSPLRELPSAYTFWEEREHGLAIYVSPGLLRRYRLPMAPEELVVIGHRFHVKSLAQAILGNVPFHLLSVTLQHAQLFECTRDTWTEVALPAMPRALEATVEAQTADRGSQSHFAMRAGHGKQTSVFHGQGGLKDVHQEDVRTYLRSVAHAVDHHLANTKTPLALAGVAYLLSILRDTLRYPHVLREQISGNPEHIVMANLHAHAWNAVSESVMDEREALRQSFLDVSETPAALTEVRDVLPAAKEGRVKALMVAEDRHVWGSASASGELMQLHSTQCVGDDDLAEVAAMDAYLTGAKLAFLPHEQMPRNAHVAAVLRG